MKKTIFPTILLTLLLFSVTLAKNPTVLIETTKGNITIELYKDKAPITVKNFLDYVDKGFYNETIFHRVIKNFMIQGGGFTENMQKKETLPPIKNEANNGLKNTLGTIAMARTNDPHSATAQFFINTKNNVPLDFVSENIQGWGYCVFGKVTEGLDIVRRIEGTLTTIRAPYSDVPVNPIVIKKVTLLK